MSEYWEYELSDAYKRIDALGADLALNAKMLARQCDLARGAETERDAVQSENERLRQELMQLRANLADFEPGKTYCAFCGESFPVEPDNALERVQEHIVVCKDHPMRVAESALTEVQRDCDAYKANSEESLDAIDLWRLENTKLEAALAEARAALENLYYYATPMAMSDRGAAVYGEAGRLLGRLANTETAGEREQFTFWLFTKGDRCIKGQGRTGGEAIAAALAELEAVK